MEIYMIYLYEVLKREDIILIGYKEFELRDVSKKN
jgi:hypothetical protein